VIPESIRQDLRYVHVSDPGLSLDRFPDFLIIGPQRTGTTWLHANLRDHPQIFLSEPKELFFFSRLKPPGHPQFESNELGWYLKFFRDPWWRWVMKQALSLRRFRELYAPEVFGEATASYAALDPDVIEDIVRLNRSIKAILMIRNPIERAWSHAKKDLARKHQRRIEDVSDTELQEFFSDDYQLRCARSTEQFDNWSACLREGHLLVGVFDDIASRPETLLLDVMRFLGVRAERKYVGGLARAAVNPTETSVIPEQHRRFLEDLLAPELDALQERFGLSWPR
jgi:hypothetical protein